MRNERSIHISRAHRAVLKAGSSLLTDPKRKGVNTKFLAKLAGEVKSLQARNVQCLIVTSGAIAAGMFEMGLDRKPKEIAKLQALAAVGQCKLMHAYETAFRRSGLRVAQILLTREDLSDKQRYSNARKTLEELFRNGIIPVVNENDTVAVEEIKFGNNDILGALVAQLCGAGLLVLLTDTDGLFEEDPRLNPKAKLIPSVSRIHSGLERAASRSGSSVGTGGMKSKILAAKSVMKSGIPMVIANGNARRILPRLLDSEPIGTFFFLASGKR